MTADVDLINMALDQISAKATVHSISPPDPGSLAAEVAQRTYQQQVDAVFRSAHWNCARMQRALTLLKAARGTPENPNGATLPVPPVPWLYEYGYPSDCLKMRFLIPNPTVAADAAPLTTNSGLNYYPEINTSLPFVPAIDTDSNGNQINVVLTNARAAIGVYTARIANPTLWDPSLKNAVIATLAAWFVNPLVRNADLLKERVAVAVAMISSARVSDGNEGITSIDHLPDWIAVRAAGSGYCDVPGGGYMLSWDSIGMPDGMAY